MAQSESIDKLAEALSAAQGEFKPAAKSATNPFLKNRYSDIGDVLDAVREALAKHGLSIVQAPEDGPPGIVVRTVLLHKSGQWIDGRMPALSGGKADAQSVGSGITYARRYSLKAVLGIADDDDDGNAAAGKTQEQKPKEAQGERPKSQPAAATAANKPAAKPSDQPAQTAPAAPAPASATSLPEAATPGADPKPASTSGPSDAPVGGGAAASASASTPSPVSKVTREQMEQLIAAGVANGWTKSQVGAFVCHAFGVKAETMSTLTVDKWEIAVRVVSQPANAGGHVVVNKDGKPLADEHKWPKKEG